MPLSCTCIRILSSRMEFMFSFSKFCIVCSFFLTCAYNLLKGYSPCYAKSITKWRSMDKNDDTTRLNAYPERSGSQAKALYCLQIKLTGFEPFVSKMTLVLRSLLSIWCQCFVTSSLFANCGWPEQFWCICFWRTFCTLKLSDCYP